MKGDLWGQLGRSDEGGASWQVGRCRLWVRSARDEWELAWRHIETDDEIPEAVPEADLAWTRYVTVADDRVEVVPALPDRPVVVRPASPIAILPGRWGGFFFRVPLWIRFVSRGEGRPSTMEEVPSRRLTSTWFGDLATGELCYAIEAPLERRLDDLHMDDAFAACEVMVRNNSRERLRFERICVHVEHMRLYDGADRLWTNELRVSFRGADQVSQLTFLPRPPARAGDAEPLSQPRIAPETGLLKRSFAVIREIAGMER
ncbi:MAG: hypothetical protein ACOC2D_13990 [Spirochaetota bacterium]